MPAPPLRLIVTRPVDVVDSTREAAVKVTGTGLDAKKLKVAVTLLPLTVQARLTSVCTGCPGAGATPGAGGATTPEAAAAASAGISGSSVPRDTVRLGVTKAGVGTTKLDEGVGPAVFADPTSAVLLAAAANRLLAGASPGTDARYHHAPPSRATATRPMRPMTTAARVPGSGASAIRRCLLNSSPDVSSPEDVSRNDN